MSDPSTRETSRRRFLKQFAILGAALPTQASTAQWQRLAAAAVRHPRPTNNLGSPTKPQRNRAPLVASEFTLLPLGSIRPTGWLRGQLRVQADGLSGHLDEFWPDVGPNSGWRGGSGESWERGPYFLDGLVPLAHLLDDATLKAKVHPFIEWTLEHQGPDGRIGPLGNDDWWPRMVMLKVLTQHYEATADPRVIPFLSRYFAYHADQMRQRPLKDWGKYRWQDEVLSVLWLYNRTGDSSLLNLARQLKMQGYDWKSQFDHFPFTVPCTAAYLGLKHGGDNNERALQSHGVNNAMALKTSPIWYLLSGKEEDRQALEHQLAELDRYHGLPNGIFSADEHFAGLNPSQGTELCTVVEAMFSLEQALAILGDAALGDRLERIAFNALPGAFTDDMWAHQYNQQPNQVEVSVHSKPWTTDGPESNLYGLEPNFGCCTANYHQGWPKFAASLVMLSKDDGLVAAAYAPCEVRTTIRNVAVRVVEETEYPFRGVVSFTIYPDRPLSCPFRFRIPAWASGATITLNGKKMAAPTAGTFASIERSWKPGDRVVLQFPMAVRSSRWFHDSVAVERGPLVFALPPEQDWLKLRDRGMTADWQVYPRSAWNYGLALRDSNPAQSIRVQEFPVTAQPFTSSHTPVTLEVAARKLPDWRAEDGVAAPVPASPMHSKQPEEHLTLIPYAAAKLRITAFPVLSTEQPHSGV